MSAGVWTGIVGVSRYKAKQILCNGKWPINGGRRFRALRSLNNLLQVQLVLWASVRGTSHANTDPQGVRPNSTAAPLLPRDPATMNYSFGVRRAIVQSPSKKETPWGLS